MLARGFRFAVRRRYSGYVCSVIAGCESHVSYRPSLRVALAIRISNHLESSIYIRDARLGAILRGSLLDGRIDDIPFDRAQRRRDLAESPAAFAVEPNQDQQIYLHFNASGFEFDALRFFHARIRLSTEKTEHFRFSVIDTHLANTGLSPIEVITPPPS